MRKILTLSITLIVFLIFTACTTDEIYESEKSEEDTLLKSNPLNIITGNDGEELECQIIFDYPDNLTFPEKIAIRNFYSNNHFPILGVEIIDNDTERWYALCSAYNAWVESMNLDPNDQICIELGCTYNQCIQNSCGEEEEEEEPIDPLHPIH